MIKKQTLAILLFTHSAAAALGFVAGFYTLPILTAPPAPSENEISALSSNTLFTAQLVRDLKGSDAFHWGEGQVSISKEAIAFTGKLAPGPDYKLYLSPAFIETEAEFERLKPSMVRVGNVDTFDNFIVAVGPEIDLSAFNTVVVWCESFGEFITAGKYREQ